MDEYINVTADNVAKEHLCCAIADKKHQVGVNGKREWLSDRLKEGHVFRKLNVNGKVFIEYAPLSSAWVPVVGDGYMYVYCLWVAGSYKGHGYGNALISYAIAEAKRLGMRGVCTISSKKKKPFLAEKTFFTRYGFVKADGVDDIELLALSFDGSMPAFTDAAKRQTIESKALTIYYSPQCPYTANCVQEITEYAKESGKEINLIKVDTASAAKEMPCVFNNWATFYEGKFVSNTLLNRNSVEKLLK